MLQIACYEKSKISEDNIQVQIALVWTKKFLIPFWLYFLADMQKVGNLEFPDIFGVKSGHFSEIKALKKYT